MILTIKQIQDLAKATANLTNSEIEFHPLKEPQVTLNVLDTRTGYRVARLYWDDEVEVWILA